MRKNATIFFILIVQMLSAKAQQITNVQVEQDGDNVVIGYDIIDAKQGQKFDISLSLSADGGKTFTITPLSITGDIKQITAGQGKKIIWNVLLDNDEVIGDNFVFMLKAKINLMVDYGIEMVFVSGGTFTMGCTESVTDCFGSEKPAHRVKVKSFLIGKYEVTLHQWNMVMGSLSSQNNQAGINNCDECPVELVSWNDIQQFISILNKNTGKKFRLPTEAEWEFAARGGNLSKGYKFSGGNKAVQVSWIIDNSGNTIHKTGLKQPNELGLFDMSGNVWEMCSDWYGEYDNLPQVNPEGAKWGTGKVLKGGCYLLNSLRSRISSRGTTDPAVREKGSGFRLVCDE